VKEEKEKTMMPETMEEMLHTMDPAKMPAMMETMMPSMMEQCFAKMNAEEMASMMHNMMPKMMENCFAKMDTAQRHDMLRMCREMLDQIEAKHTSHKA
jgi:Mg/Co/Ni transporter MgtE